MFGSLEKASMSDVRGADYVTRELTQAESCFDDAGRVLL